MLHPVLRASSFSFVMADCYRIMPKTAIRSCISRRKDGAVHWFTAGYCPHSACISRGWAGCIGKTSSNISNLKGPLGLYLAKHEDVFLNSVKGFGEHLGLYLAGRESLAPLFSSPPPFFLVIGVLLSPRLDNIISAKPVIRILSAKALVVLALPDFPARRRTRLLARSNSSIRHEHPAATCTTLLSRHHHSFSLNIVMASLY